MATGRSRRQREGQERDRQIAWRRPRPSSLSAPQSEPCTRPNTNTTIHLTRAPIRQQILTPIQAIARRSAVDMADGACTTSRRPWRECRMCRGERGQRAEHLPRAARARSSPARNSRWSNPPRMGDAERRRPSRDPDDGRSRETFTSAECRVEELLDAHVRVFENRDELSMTARSCAATWDRTVTHHERGRRPRTSIGRAPYPRPATRGRRMPAVAGRVR